MRLSVLLMFLLALALSFGSGSRCQKAWNKPEGYKEFSEKHILSMDIKRNPKVKELNDIFERYLQKHDLCGRVALQTFFKRTDRKRVESICNGHGFADGSGNLCISEQKFTVYMVESRKVKSGCKVKKVNAEKLYVVVGCGKIKDKCLPVHFEKQTKVAPNKKAARCKPKQLNHPALTNKTLSFSYSSSSSHQTQTSTFMLFPAG